MGRSGARVWRLSLVNPVSKADSWCYPSGTITYQCNLLVCEHGCSLVRVSIGTNIGQRTDTDSSCGGQLIGKEY